MPTATKFMALGAGNGFPFCIATASGYGNVNGTSLEGSALTLAEAMALYYNLYSLDVEATGLSYTSPASGSVVSVPSVTRTNVSDKEPMERACSAAVFGTGSETEFASDPESASLGVLLVVFSRGYRGNPSVVAQKIDDDYSVSGSITSKGYSYSDLSNGPTESQVISVTTFVEYANIFSTYTDSSGNGGDDGFGNPTYAFTTTYVLSSITVGGVTVPIVTSVNRQVGNSISDPGFTDPSGSSISDSELYTY